MTRRARSAAAQPPPPDPGEVPPPIGPRAQRASPEERAQERRTVVRVPVDTTNEQVLLAAAIVSPDTRARLTRALQSDGFHGKGHAAAWSALAELDRRGLYYDPATVRQIAGDEVDTDYLDGLVAQRPAAPPNLAFHVEAFMWDRRRVESAGPLQDLLQAIEDVTATPERVAQLAQALARALGGSGSLRFMRKSGSVAAGAKARVRERRRRYAAGHRAFPYGIDGLDLYEDGTPRLIPGMEPKRMTLIAGESGSAKTTLTNRIVLSRVNAGLRCCHGAWEEDGETNLELLAGFSVGIDRTRLMLGAITDAEQAALDAEMDRLDDGSDRPLVKFFELPFARERGERRTRSLNDEQIDVVHEHVELSRCDFAVFDLFAKVMVESRPDDEKRALDRMLGIAKETNTHLILVHHLKKQDIDRPDKRPTRDAIKGSTAWIDAFDTVLGTYIPGNYKSCPKNTMEVLVLKQRHGVWPLAVELDYDARFGRISGGRSIEYDQPGEQRGGLGGMLDEAQDRRARGRGR